MDLLCRVQGGQAHGATLRLHDLDPETTTVGNLREKITAELSRDDIDLVKGGGRLFLAGFSLLDNSVTLGEILGHGVTGDQENKKETPTPTLNIVPKYIKKNQQPNALETAAAAAIASSTSSDGKSEVADDEDVQNVLKGMLKSLYAKRMPHKKSYAERVLRSSVEASEVRLANDRTWIVNGFKNGDVLLPPAHSKDLFLPLKHAVEINNVIDTTIHLEKCVHLNIVNAKRSKIFLGSVVTSVEVTHCEDCELHVTGVVGTIQLDMSREVSIFVDANDAADKTVFVCASTTDISIHVRDNTGTSLHTSGGMPRIVDIPVSFLDSQTASKLHSEEIVDDDGQKRVDWTLRTLGQKVLKPAGAKYLRLNLLDSGEWAMRRRSTAEDLAALERQEQDKGGDANDD